MLSTTWATFYELSVEELYAILALRAAVFVVEQKCSYLDADGVDLNAHHLLLKNDGVLVAYLRLYFKENAPGIIVFGRVVTAQHVRGKGYGKTLITELLDFYQKHYAATYVLECSAQLYLKKFYESFGFKAESEAYIEEGITHIHMRLSNF